jgi:Putative DNA-binding domain
MMALWIALTLVVFIVLIISGGRTFGNRDVLIPGRGEKSRHASGAFAGNIFPAWKQHGIMGQIQLREANTSVARVRRNHLESRCAGTSMPIDRLDFDNLAENDISELVAAQVPEGLRIDYKKDLYGHSDAEKREALKDVSAFANAFGGHLIIGIEEQNGLPTAIPGVANVNPDDIILRLEQLIRTGVDPGIQGLRVRAVPLANGAYCFVLRIPRSWHPPHRVTAQNSNRFWIRNSGGAHEASVEELRTLFTLGADALHRVHQFRDERLSEINSGNSARPLQGNGRLIIHIVPLAAVTSPWQVNLTKVFESHLAFRPIGTMGMTPRFNFEGFVNERGGDQNFGYTQIFRNGALEATKGKIIVERDWGRVIPGQKFERDIFEVLPGYLNGLRDVGVPPPLVVLFTLEGVKGVHYSALGGICNEPEPAIEREVLFLPECLINEYGPEVVYHRAVRPSFDALWNTTGRASAQSFSVDGIWGGNV